MVRTVLYTTICIIFKLDKLKCMEPFIVGGEPAKVEYFAHSAFLNVENSEGMFVCGASIVNQNVILTAAHCLEGLDKSTKVTVRAGNANWSQGAVRGATKLAIHKNYDTETVGNDIGMVYVKQPFVLGPSIKRIIITENPPKRTYGIVAGWGMTNEYKSSTTDWLQQTKQKVLSGKECRNIIKMIPEGSLCGGDKSSENYVSSGDSGSALVVDGSIQIGLVSFKRPEVSRALGVYTSVAYHYSWISSTSRRLVCQ